MKKNFRKEARKLISSAVLFSLISSILSPILNVTYALEGDFTSDTTQVATSSGTDNQYLGLELIEEATSSGTDDQNFDETETVANIVGSYATGATTGDGAYISSTNKGISDNGTIINIQDNDSSDCASVTVNEPFDIVCDLDASSNGTFTQLTASTLTSLIDELDGYSASLKGTGTGIVIDEQVTLTGGIDAVAQEVKFTPENVEEGDYFQININETPIGYMSNSGTVSEIVSGLTNAINSSSESSNVTATDNSTYITVLSDVAGVAFTYVGLSDNFPGNFQISEITPSNPEIGDTFEVTIDGTNLEYTSISGTIDEVKIGLINEINAQSGALNVFATGSEESTGSLVVMGQMPGESFTISTGTTNAPALPQITEFTPMGSVIGMGTYRAIINDIFFNYTANGSDSIEDIVDGLQAMMNTGAVSCVDNVTKITCTGLVPGTPFTFDSYILDTGFLTMTINQEFEDGPNRTIYFLDSDDYTTTSWNNYTTAISSSITVEQDDLALPEDVNGAIQDIEDTKEALELDLFDYDFQLTNDSSTESSIDSASYNGLTYATYVKDGDIYFVSGKSEEEFVGEGTNPTIAVGTGGIAHIAYQSGSTVLYQNNMYGMWNPPIAISTGSITPDIAVSSTGTVYIVTEWTNPEDSQDRDNILLYTGNGINSFTGGVLLNGWYANRGGADYDSNNYSYPKIEIDVDGNYHITTILRDRSKDMRGSTTNFYIKYITNIGGGNTISSTSAGTTALTLSKNPFALNEEGTPFLLYKWTDNNYYLANITNGWTTTILGSSSDFQNPSLAIFGTGTIGVSYIDSSQNIKYTEKVGNSFVGTATIDTHSVEASLSMSNDEIFVHYIHNDMGGTNNDDVYLVSTTDQYTVPGIIDEVEDSFINFGSGVTLGELQIGASYSITTGTGTQVGGLFATGSTGTSPLNPMYFGEYGYYTLTLNGSYSGTTSNNIDSKNFYIGPFDFVEEYHLIDSELFSYGGIETNLDTVTYENVTDFQGLYFEIDDYGRIDFSGSLDLTNSGTIDFLFDLEDYLDMDNGYIELGGEMLTMYPATLQMYGLPLAYSGMTLSPNDIVVVDNDNIWIDSNNVLDNINIDCSELDDCSIIFDTQHFTSFNLKPILTDVSIESNNTYSGALAKAGDTISLYFTGSEVLENVVVYFDGELADNIIGTGTTWNADITIPDPGNDGTISFTIQYKDIDGNSGEDITGTTDGTSIKIDTTAPYIDSEMDINYNPVSLTANNVIASIFYTAEPVIITNNSGATQYTFTENGTFDFEYRDLAGNKGSTTISVDNIDKSEPIITLNGDNPQYVEWLGTYSELGASWNDNNDGTGTVDSDDIGGDEVDENSLGNYFVTYIYTNNLGVTGTGTREVIVQDTTKPTASIEYSKTGATADDVIASLTAPSENIAITSDGGFNHTFTENGSFTFEFEDNSGNTGSVVATVNNIDKSAPVITLTGDNPQYVEWLGSYSEAGAERSDHTDGTGSDISTSGSINTSILGSQSMLYLYTNSLGVTGTGSRTVIVQDTTSPTATVTYSETGTTADDVIATLTGASEDITITNNSGSTTYTFTANGSFTFEFEDSVGNTGNTVATVDNINKSVPVINLIGTDPQYVEQFGSYTESGAIYSDQTDGTGAVVDITGSVNEDVGGDYTINYSFTNSLGVTGTGSRTVTVQDTTSPTASVTYSETGTTADDVIATLTGTSEDITITNNGGSANYTFTANGSFTFEFEDSVGNTGSTVATVDNINKSVPIINLVGTDPQYVEQFGSYTESGAIYSDQTDGTGAVVDITGSVNEDVGGDYTINYSFTNSLGVTGTGSRTVTVQDTTSPTASVTYSETGTTADDVIATLTGTSEDITITNNGGSANYTFTANGSFTFEFEDSVGNTGSTVATVDNINKSVPIINLVGTDPQYVEQFGSYTESGAIYSDQTDGTGAVVDITGSVNEDVGGDYTINYSFTNSLGVTGTGSRTVTVQDTTSPTATVEYNPSTTTADDVIATLTGASENITITNNGGSTTYTFTENGSFTFEFQDNVGNTGSTTATVSNINKSVPTITIIGNNPLTIERTESYTESGATWSDQTDGTGTVSTISGSVDGDTVGVYQIVYEYENSLGLKGTATKIINVVDTIAPNTPTITNSDTLTKTSTIDITGTGSGEEYIEIYNSGTLIGTGIISPSGNISESISLNEGDNPINIKSYDSSGNYSELSNTVVITKDSTKPNIVYHQVTNITETGALLTFVYNEPHFVGQTTSFTVNTIGTFPVTYVGEEGTSQITGLSADTLYNYTLILTDDLSNQTVKTGSFTTPVVITGTGTFTETGPVSLGFTGSIGTGSTKDMTQVKLEIGGHTGDTDYVEGTLTLSGITIGVETGEWNGILLPPKLIDPEAPEAGKGSEIGSGMTVAQTIKAGSEGAGLQAQGGYFDVSFKLPGYSSGTVFSLYRSQDGNTWELNSPDPTCTLNSSLMCSFRTDHLTLFAPTIDTTPDAFTFTDLTGKALSTSYKSNIISVSGINAASSISITGGEYKIGTGAYTSAIGTVNNGNTVTVKQTSSSSYSTKTTATLNIGGVTADFNVTTTTAPSTGGGGGGGRRGRSYDSCTIEEHLICKLSLTGVYKYYTKDGAKCTGGDLGKLCSIDEVEVETTTSSGNVETIVTTTKVTGRYVSTNTKLNIFAQKLDEKVGEKNKSYTEKVLELRNNLIIKLEEYLEASKAGDKDTMNSLKNGIINSYTEFLKKLNSKTEKYSPKNTLITQVASQLDKNISKKITDENSEVWKIRNQFLEKLDELVDNKANLSKEELVQMRAELITMYKEILSSIK